MKSQKQGRTKVFISYSHQDVEWLERLRVHLKPLERDYPIEVWDDSKIKPGSKWREEIAKALETAKAAVLLVSADFLASDFIVTNELPQLLNAAVEEGAVILPVILSPSRFTKTIGLGQFQTVNDPARPLISMSRSEQEAIFVQVADSIEVSLKESRYPKAPMLEDAGEVEHSPEERRPPKATASPTAGSIRALPKESGHPKSQAISPNEEEIAKNLNSLVTHGSETSGLIISMGGYYVQFLLNSKESLYCEAVSNRYLPPKLQITEHQISQLKALGFEDPKGGEGTSNYSRTFDVSATAAIREIAKTVLHIFLTVYNRSPQTQVEFRYID